MTQTTRRTVLLGLLTACALATRSTQAQAQRLTGDVPRVQPVTARHGMVSSQEARATRIGVEILEKGGNAVDAAVAVGFALAVTYPRAGNIGGGGFMVIHLADGNRQTAIDYRETAPARNHARHLSSTSAATPIRRSRATSGRRSACRARSRDSRWRIRNTAPANSRSPN